MVAGLRGWVAPRREELAQPWVENENNKPPMSRDDKKFDLGERVEVLVMGKGRGEFSWDLGTVTKVRLNGTYDVDYDAGGSVQKVNPSNLKRSKEMAEKNRFDTDPCADMIFGGLASDGGADPNFFKSVEVPSQSS